jgi:hypothetical protein
MWFQAIYPFKAQQILNKTLSSVIAKVMYTFNLDIYTVKQPNYPHQVTNKPADNIKRLVEPADTSFMDINIVFKSARGSCLMWAL